MSTPTPQEWRTLACQEQLRDLAADAALVVPGANLRYLTGVTEAAHERLFVCVVPASAPPVFVVPALSGESVREATWVDDVRTWDDGDDPTAVLEAVLDETLEIPGGTDTEHDEDADEHDEDADEHDEDADERDGVRLLLDDSMPARLTLPLQSAVDAEYGLASDVLGRLRSRKDDAELDALEAAAAVADDVMMQLFEERERFVGRTESDLAAVIERRLDDAGGESPSFEPIVASGPNSAKPHHEHGDRVLEVGDPVVLDFGARVDGYPSDTTRTVVLSGDPPDGFREVHEVVAAAQQAAVDAVEPGIEARVVDSAARDVIESAGYGESFIHRTGHGVGLDVHEEPYVASDSTTELEPGMVFSVEPGVYLEGEFGVRIEDLVVVTEDGCRRLNDSPRGW